MKRLEYFFLRSYTDLSEGDYARLRLLLQFIVLSIGFAIFYIADSFITGFTMARYFMYGALAVFMFQLLALRLRWLMRMQSQLFIAASFVIISLLAFFSGGLYSVITPWLVMIPVLTFLLSNRRSSWFWLILSMAALAVLGSGVEPPASLSFTSLTPAVFYLSLTGGLVMLMFALTSLFDRQQQTLLRTIADRNSQLSATEEELRQNFEELSTTQETLARREAESLSIIRALHDHFIVSEYDTEGRLLQGNALIEKITGTPIDELLGKVRTDFLAEEFRQEFQNNWNKVLTGVSVSQELHFRFPAREFWAKTTLAPILSSRGEVSRVLGISHEITELKEKQREVSQMNDQLQETLASLEKQHTLLLQNQQLLSHRQRVLQRYTETLVDMAKHEALQQGDFQVALQYILTVAGAAMGVGRISVWRYDAQTASIICEGLFSLKEEAFSSGDVLYQQDYPNYFASILKGEIIAANEARFHASTSEFRASYLEPLDIHSMLDAPLFFDGELYGMLCCEHQGQAVHWLQEDSTFAKSVCEMITVALSSCKRREAEARIMEQNEFIRSQNDDLLRLSTELRSLNMNLEKRVLERTKELESQNARLSEYAYINAHLLRGPLCRIMGLLNLMDVQGNEPDREIVPLLRRSTQELDAVIQKITNLIEAGRALDRAYIRVQSNDLD